MRTPGHDFELAAGFCFTEGLLAGAPVRTCRYCGTGSAVESEFNVVTVETGGLAPVPTPRLTVTSSACGMCGTTAIDELRERLHPLPPSQPLPARRRWRRCPTGSIGDQELFAATGAVHAAAAFDRRRRAAARAGGHRPPQRRRQGRRPAAARRAPARRRPRAVRERPGQLRDRAEGVGGRLRHGRGRERPVVAGRGGRPPGRPHPVRLRPRRRAERLRPRAPGRGRPGGRGRRTAPVAATSGRPVGLREQLTGWHPRLWAGLAAQRHRRAEAEPLRATWPRSPGTTAATPSTPPGADPGRVRRLRPRRHRPPRLDHRRRPPLHHPPRPAEAQHGRPVRPDGARRRRRPAGDGAGPSCGRWAASPTRCAGAGASRASAGSAGTRRSTPWPTGIRATGADRAALYLTSRGITNEVYYAAGKAAAGPRHGQRRLGGPGVPRPVDGRAEGRPSASAATTCSFQDVIESHLVVLWGANPANNQPVFMKYLYLARRRGCRVVVVNPYLEPGLDRYWVPSNVESALFGTKMCDLHVPVRPGGDVALANAALKRLVERGAVDEAFVAAHTEGWDELAAGLEAQDARRPARRRRRRPRHARRLRRRVRPGGRRPSSCGRWGSPSTATPSTASAPSSTWPWPGATSGRDGAGLMPIRATRGCRAAPRWGPTPPPCPAGCRSTRDHAAALAEQWGFPVPDRARAHRPRDGRGRRPGRPRRAVDVRRQLPRRPARPAAGRGRPRPGCRCASTRTSCVTSPDAGPRRRRDPAAGRHPLRAGGRRHRDDHRAADRLRPRDPPAGGRGPQRVAAVRRRRPPGPARPARPRSRGPTTRRCGPRSPGWSPPTPASRTWPTPGTSAVGRPPPVRRRRRSRRRRAGPGSPRSSRRPDDLPEGPFVVATRRGKQFNSMVHGRRRPAHRRRARRRVHRRDRRRRSGLADGDRGAAALRDRAYEGRLRSSGCPPARLQVHWPEGNVLVAGGPDHREPASKVPDYNAVVTLERVS